MVEAAVANNIVDQSRIVRLGVYVYVYTVNGNNICKKYLRYHHFRSLPAILDIRQKNKDEPEVVIYYNP